MCWTYSWIGTVYLFVENYEELVAGLKGPPGPPGIGLTGKQGPPGRFGEPG